METFPNSFSPTSLMENPSSSFADSNSYLQCSYAPFSSSFANLRFAVLLIALFTSISTTIMETMRRSFGSESFGSLFSASFSVVSHLILYSALAQIIFTNRECWSTRSALVGVGETPVVTKLDRGHEREKNAKTGNRKIVLM